MELVRFVKLVKYLKLLLGLSDQDNFHEFARFLAKFKGNYQFVKICSSENFPDWISKITPFTMRSFQAWEVELFKFYYLFILYFILLKLNYFLVVRK
jgi:hypothetical protein